MTSTASALRLCTASVVLVVWVALPPRAAARQSVATDRAALLALYDATGGPAWTNGTSWKTPAPLADWHGVTTDAGGRVTGLSLPDNGLAGRLPASLGRLDRLRVLSLRGNELTGPVPRWLGRLTQLGSIDLGSNAFTGPVPEVLGRLGGLESLALGRNGLTGPIPAWLGDLIDLRLLDLGGNGLTGPIPSSLERLRNLDYLSLGGNDLVGPLPAWLGGLAELRVLDLGANRLSGPIPARLGDLIHLEWLALDRNELVGAIPETLARLRELAHLSLGGNELVGPVPSWVGRLAKLARLDLHGNALLGPLPDGLRHLTGLEHLSLRGNALSGPAPPWLGDLVNLRVLDLGSNALSGALPPALGHLPHLQELRVDGTSLTGPLPQGLTRPPRLALLAFHDSALCAPADIAFREWLATLEEWTGAACGRPEGSIMEPTAHDVDAPDAGHPKTATGVHAAAGPRSDRNALVALYDATGGPNWSSNAHWKTGRPLGEWHGVTTDAAGRVVRLTLYRNGLTGRIPPALGRLTKLEQLDLGFNELTGRIPRALSRLTQLRSLSVSINELTGPIPDWLGQLTRLEGLDLSWNRLSGGIPPALGRLTNLDWLHLAANRELTGRMPVSLGRLTNLRSLDLSGNSLTGRVPPALGRLTNLRRLRLHDNKALTGRIPPELGRLTRLEELSLSRTALSGRVPPELGRLSRLRRLYLGTWGLTGRLPAGLRRSRLETLTTFGSQACAPAGWRDWVKTIAFNGALCGTRPDVTIDVLVVYTPAASRRAGGTDAVEATIDRLIAETNEAFRASGVRPRLDLVGRSEVRYSETGDQSLDLGRLVGSSDGHMDRVHAMRRRTGADLVHLLVGDSLGGTAAGTPGVFSLSRISDLVHHPNVRNFAALFAHELGHSMGLHHARYEEGDGAVGHASPNYGYVNQRAFEAGAPASSRWRTIMAYGTRCGAEGFSCSLVMRFSNPRQRLHGDPLGIPFGSGPWGVTGPADAAAWLNRVGPAVAARLDR